MLLQAVALLNVSSFTHWTARRNRRCSPVSGGWRCPCSTSPWRWAEHWWPQGPTGMDPAARGPWLHPGCVSAGSGSGSTVGNWEPWQSAAATALLRGDSRKKNSRSESAWWPLTWPWGKYKLQNSEATFLLTGQNFDWLTSHSKNSLFFTFYKITSRISPRRNTSI